MKTRKKNTTEPKRMLLLVCATEAEALYFSQMRKDCRYVNLTVLQAPEGSAKDLQSLLDWTGRQRSKGRFDSAWALFGFDDVSTDADSVKSMEEYAEKKKVRMLYFNPSFELWFILHLGAPTAFMSNITPFKDKLKTAIPGYEFTPEYFLTNGLNLHIKLFPRHSAADLNARNYNSLALSATGLKATTMPDFNENLTEICGLADMSHNQKVRR